MKIARVGVQNGHLTTGGSHHMGMTMSHMAHVVDPVQVSLPILAEKILSPTPYNFQGIFIGNTQISSQMGATGGLITSLAILSHPKVSIAILAR